MSRPAATWAIACKREHPAAPAHRPNRSIVGLALTTTQSHRCAVAAADNLRLRARSHELYGPIGDDQRECRRCPREAETLRISERNAVLASEHLPIGESKRDWTTAHCGADELYAEWPTTLSCLVQGKCIGSGGARSESDQTRDGGRRLSQAPIPVFHDVTIPPLAAASAPHGTRPHGSSRHVALPSTNSTGFHRSPDLCVREP